MKRLILLVPFICFRCLVSAQTDSVYQSFISPPDAAKPRVWWHWMNGNITKDGIKKDLLWMKRSGIGGFQNFDASLMTPQIVGETTYLHDARMEGCISIHYKIGGFIEA